MFYVCQNCGKYNLSKAPCTACGNVGTKSAAFGLNEKTAVLIPTTHKLWTSKFYHYVCTQDVQTLSLLFFNQTSNAVYPFFNDLKNRAINRLWDDIPSNPRDAEEIFPTKAVMERINARKRAEMARRLREEEKIRHEQQLLSRYPDWFKQFSTRFSKESVFVRHQAGFEDNGRIFRFDLKAIKADEKQTVCFDCYYTTDEDISNTTVYRDKRTINMAICNAASVDDMLFRLLKQYAKSYADSDRLSFITVMK